jgi:hypothetical protein
MIKFHGTSASYRMLFLILDVLYEIYKRPLLLAMCLKVALLATVLCIGICLPINYTVSFSDEDTTKECSRSERFDNITNFEKKTLAAIPQIIPIDKIFASTIAPSTLLVRFYTILLEAWLLYIYIIRLLQR